MQYLSNKKPDGVKTKNIPYQLINYGLKSARLGQNDFLKSSARKCWLSEIEWPTFLWMPAVNSVELIPTSFIFGRVESGRTHLIYLPKYFRKAKRENKAEQKRGRGRRFKPNQRIFFSDDSLPKANLFFSS
jgi:hypothetical protein